jgi:hypothetical protein
VNNWEYQGSNPDPCIFNPMSLPTELCSKRLICLMNQMYEIKSWTIFKLVGFIVSYRSNIRKKSSNNTTCLPVSVAFQTHWMIAIGQYNDGVHLHANITLFFSLCINFRAFSFVYHIFRFVPSSTQMFLFPIINISDSSVKLQ